MLLKQHILQLNYYNIKLATHGAACSWIFKNILLFSKLLRVSKHKSLIVFYVCTCIGVYYEGLGMSNI